MKTELVWEGKYDEYGNRRTVVKHRLGGQLLKRDLCWQIGKTLMNPANYTWNSNVAIIRKVKRR